MSETFFEGTWILIKSAAEKRENTAVDNSDQTEITLWLQSTNPKLKDTAAPDDGFQLVIDADGNFTEQTQKTIKADWYNEEGVLDNTTTPFNGKIVAEYGKQCIVPLEIPSFGIPEEGKYDLVMRYDDGDTKICDIVELIDGQLVRTINVVTDELYFDRIVLVYQKQ